MFGHSWTKWKSIKLKHVEPRNTYNFNNIDIKSPDSKELSNMLERAMQIVRYSDAQERHCTVCEKIQRRDV